MMQHIEEGWTRNLYDGFLYRADSMKLLESRGQHARRYTAQGQSDILESRVLVMESQKQRDVPCFGR